MVRNIQKKRRKHRKTYMQRNIHKKEFIHRRDIYIVHIIYKL